MRYRASEVLAEGGRAVRTLHVLYGRGSVTRARPGWCGGERCTCYILTVIATPPSPCCHTVGVWGGLRRGGARTTVDTAGARPVGHCVERATPRMRSQAVRGAATASQNGKRRKRRGRDGHDLCFFIWVGENRVRIEPEKGPILPSQFQTIFTAVL